VAQIYRLTFPRVRVVLRLSDGRRVVGEPLYRYQNGNLDLSDPATVENLGCFYWLPGDRVRVRLTRKEAGEGDYLFAESRRLGPGTVPRTGREEPDQGTGGHPMEGILATLVTDKTRYAPGEPVRLRMTFQNTIQTPLRLNFPSSQRFDIVAEREGRRVWQWSQGRMFLMVLGFIDLGPGQSFAAEEVWDQKDNSGHPVAPGRYTLIARLTARQPPVLPEARAAIRIGSAGRSAMSIKDILSDPDGFLGRTVTIEGEYRGWKPDPEAPQCRMGPPVTRGDWAIRDETGTLYVTGKGLYDPIEDIGKPVSVVATVRKNATKGQIYLEAKEVSE